MRAEVRKSGKAEGKENSVIARFPSVILKASSEQSPLKELIASTKSQAKQSSSLYEAANSAYEAVAALPEFTNLSATVYFYTWDHLGTARLIIDINGNILSRHDFEPYGVELPPTTSTANHIKYTGQERDNYTNYDYMHFRFYASSMGRFLKPDNIISNVFNPQSWNLYSYVKGNPVNYADPTGHDIRGKQGNMGMHQALMGVPNVDITGMLTPVEIYEWFGWNILYGNVPTGGEYYHGLYLGLQSISGKLNASHQPFNNWVSDLEAKGLNIDAETMYYLKSIYQMSKNYGVELAFYISPTKSNGLAIIVIFGSEMEVDISISSNEAAFFRKTLGFNWQKFFIFGHTHPAAGKDTSFGNVAFGASEEDIMGYSYELSCFPWCSGIILQESSQGQLIIQLIEFFTLPNGVYRNFWLVP